MEHLETNQEPLRVDEYTRRHLGELSRWARFLGTAGMILSLSFIFMLLFSGDAVMQSMYATNPALKEMKGVGKMVIAVLIAIMLMPLFISFYLFRSGRRLFLGLQHERQDYLNNSLYNLKLVFRIFGIFAIIYFSFLLLGILGSLLSA